MTLPAGYFTGLYSRSADPWKIGASWYEDRKRAIGLAILPQPHYKYVFEPGCGNGDLTVLLASRCDRLLAWDVVPAAVDRAAERLRSASHARVAVGEVPREWPGGMFDLVVLSELCYYLDHRDLDALLDRVEATLTPGGTVLAVHWRHHAPGYPQTAETVQDYLCQRSRLAPLARYADDDMLATVLVATPPAPRSVAALSGLV